MAIIQLEPTIPVYIPHKNIKGYALGWIDYSQEHNLIWVCALENSEIWLLENHQVRVQYNETLNRKGVIYEKES
jgi:hypothetical protein